MIRFLSPDEIDRLLPEIYHAVFGEHNLQHAPSVVAVVEKEGGIVSFLSGYWQDRLTFYIQFAGAMPEFRGNHTGTGQLADVLSHIGAKFFLTMIKNDNYPAMKIVMNAGFVLVGVRQDSEKTLYGEWLLNLLHKKEIKNA